MVLLMVFSMLAGGCVMQQGKDLVLTLQWLRVAAVARFDPWPREFPHLLQVQPKE